jgi:hypothetical protein
MYWMGPPRATAWASLSYPHPSFVKRCAYPPEAGPFSGRGYYTYLYRREKLNLSAPFFVNSSRRQNGDLFAIPRDYPSSSIPPPLPLLIRHTKHCLFPLSFLLLFFYYCPKNLLIIYVRRLSSPSLIYRGSIYQANNNYSVLIFIVFIVFRDTNRLDNTDNTFWMDLSVKNIFLEEYSV